MENTQILYMLDSDAITIIKRLKKLPETADTDDICMALDEIIYELGGGL